MTASNDHHLAFGKRLHPLYCRQVARLFQDVIRCDDVVLEPLEARKPSVEVWVEPLGAPI